MTDFLLLAFIFLAAGVVAELFAPRRFVETIKENRGIGYRDYQPLAFVA